MEPSGGDVPSTPSVRECPECGSDPWLSREFPRVRDENAALRKRLVIQAREHAAAKELWEIERLEWREWQRANSRKTSRQAKVIRRLEKRLRDSGRFPYRDSDEARP